MTSRNQRKISRIRRQIEPDILAEYEAARVDLLAMTRNGSLLRREIDNRINLAGLRITELVSNAGRELDAIATAYAHEQFDELARYEALPAFSQVDGDTAAQRYAIVSETIAAGVTAWADSARARMKGELLRVGIDADSSDVIARLLAEQITDGRASAYRKSQNSLRLTVDSTLWTAFTALTLALFNAGQRRMPQITWQKQAIAAVDERTTDCCLRVHGQIQPVDGKFNLTGTPRFANRLAHPPFHWYCRSSVVLYHESMEGTGVPTADMRAAARDELDARRRTGRREEIHPAHSISRR